MDKIKVAVIGLGLMGQSQVRNCFDKSEDFEVVAVCDNYRPHLDSIKDYFDQTGRNVETYTDYKDMLNECDMDLVAIVTPDFLHEEMALACLEKRRHLRLEKPMAITIDGCKRIQEAAKKAGTVVQIGLELRYADVIEKIRNNINEIGDVKLLWCHEFRHPLLKKEGSIPDWIISRKYSGGTLLEKNCHHFDLFNMFAGAKPVTVYASGDNQVEYKHTDILDNAFVTVEYENGVRAMLALCLFAPPKNGQRHMPHLEFGLLGSKGRIDMRDDELFIWDRAGKSEMHYTYIRNNYEAHCEDINLSLKDLAKCIREGTQPLTDIHAGLNSIIVAVAAEISAAEKRIVYIKELEQKYKVSYKI